MPSLKTIPHGVWLAMSVIELLCALALILPAFNKPLTSPSELIDARIKELTDWRGEVLSRIRRLIKQADPEVVEEVKWRIFCDPLFFMPVSPPF
jgi:hypothetical protein